jgi:hypothetical protein
VRWAQVILGSLCAGSLVWHLFAPPVPAAGFRWMAASALFALSAYLCVHLRASLQKARFLLPLACFAVMALAAGAGPAAAALTVVLAWAFARAAGGTAGELAALLVLFQPDAFAAPPWLAPAIFAVLALPLWASGRARVRPA